MPSLITTAPEERKKLGFVKPLRSSASIVFLLLALFILLLLVLSANASGTTNSHKALVVVSIASPPPTLTSLPVPKSPTQHLFNIPGGDAGISVWYGTEGLYGFAAMPDGTFWVGDWTKTADPIGGRLLHYSLQGQLLTATPAPGAQNSGDMAGMVRDLDSSGANLWAIVDQSVYGMGPDGKVTSINPLPNEIDAEPVVSAALEMGPNGEVLIISGGDDAHPAQVLDGQGTLAAFTSGADGKTNLTSLQDLPGPSGARYMVALDPSSGLGTLMVSGNSTVIKESYQITALHILRVNKDGSVLVMSERDTGGAGNHDDIRQTLLLFKSDGTLLGRAALPFPGRYIDVVRQLAVDDAGSVYALYQSDPRQFSVDLLNFYPPDAAPPLPFIPTSTPTYTEPTATPPPDDLQGLARDAEIIADVEVTYSFTDGAVLHVRNWIEPFTIQMERDEQTYNVPYLNVTGDPADMRLLKKGSRYVLFMGRSYRYGECKLPEDEFGLISGRNGIFPVQGNRIGTGYIQGYSGKSLSEFEADIFNLLPDTLRAPPTVAPDTGAVDLLSIARSSQYIAEVRVESEGAGAGRIFYNYHVLEWLKKPAGFPTDDLDMGFGKCEPIPTAQPGQRLIIFLNNTPYKDSEGVERDYYQLTGGESGIMRSEASGIIRWAGIGHYRGWTFIDTERAIRQAVQASGNYTPSPTPAP